MTLVQGSLREMHAVLLATSRSNCGRCGSVVWRGARFCVGCGSEIRPPHPLAGRSADPPWPADDARASEDLFVPGSMIGDFCVQQLLGMGAMGTVYGAVHPELGDRVAIKVIRRDLAGHSEARERFLREAQAAGRVRHANLVDVFTHGQLADQRLFLVMEWLEGETLRDRLARQLLLADVVSVGEQVAHALDALHAERIVHRDLKPDNVFLVHGEARQLVKLLDLGVAKLLDDPPGVEPLTRRGIVIGTAAYSSPEQASGQTIDPRSDIYALGVMLFELLAGRRPFEAEKPIDLLVEHISRPVPHLADFRPAVPRELDHLVFAMMAKDAGRRPTLRDVRGTLARYAGAGLSVGVLPREDDGGSVHEISLRDALQVGPDNPSTRITAQMALPRLEIAADLSARITLLGTAAAQAHPPPLRRAPSRRSYWMGALALAAVIALFWLATAVS